MRAAFAALLVALLAATAWADGKLFQPAIVRDAPRTPEQRALLAFDAQLGIETLVIETTVDRDGGAPADELAWIVPLPAKPRIEASTTGLFPALEMFCAPEIRMRPDATWLVILGFGLGGWATVRWWERPLRPLAALGLYWATVTLSVLGACAMFPPGCSAATMGTRAEAGAQVLARQTVGVFETTTLTATDAPALRRWLTDNGFAAPPAIDPVVDDLLEEGWVFVASKVRPDAAEGVARLHPLSFTFRTAEPVYPMRLTGVDAEPLDLALFVCGEQRAEADGMTVTHCDGNADLDGWTFHDEFARRGGGAPVVTKLVGTFDAAAMTRDVSIRWTPFEPERATLLTWLAAAHAAGSPAAIIASMVLLIAAFVSRRIPSCSGWRPTRFDAGSFVTALVIGGITYGVAYGSVDRVPADADVVTPDMGGLREFLAEPPDAIAGNPPAIRAWAAAATADLENPYTGGPIREEDSPGNWWLRERDHRMELVVWEPWRVGETIDVSRRDALTGTVRAADGTAVPGAEIRFREADPTAGVSPATWFGADATARTDDDGAFTAHLQAGRSWDVAVAPEGRPYVLIEDVAPGAGALDVVLPSAGTLRGRVVDADGRPVRNVTVGAHPESPVDVYEERFVTTDAEGFFVIEGLDADTDDLWVTLHVHDEPDCTARGKRRFRGQLPVDEPFELRVSR